MNGNRLTMIPKDDLAPYTKLNYFDVSSNSNVAVEEFPILFSNGFTLVIADNPLHCDLQLMWMKKLVTPASLVISSQLCAIPDEYVGKNWTDIEITEGSILFF